METRIVGSGMTAHRQSHAVLEPPFSRGDITELVKAMNAAGPWGWLEREVGIAESTLAEIEDRQLAQSDPTVFLPHEGAGWYSREIIERAGAIRSAVARGDTETAARMAYQLGQLANAIRLKRAWEPDVLDALRTEETRREGGRKTRGRGSVAERMARWQHHHSVTGKKGEADASTAAEFGVKTSTIRAMRTNLHSEGGKN